MRCAGATEYVDNAAVCRNDSWNGSSEILDVDINYLSRCCRLTKSVSLNATRHHARSQGSDRSDAPPPLNPARSAF